MLGCPVPSGISAYPCFSLRACSCSAFPQVVSVRAWVPLCSAFLCREGPFYHPHLSVSPEAGCPVLPCGPCLELCVSYVWSVLPWPLLWPSLCHDGLYGFLNTLFLQEKQFTVWFYSICLKTDANLDSSLMTVMTWSAITFQVLQYRYANDIGIKISEARRETST